MSFLPLLVLSLGLAMDATAVAAARGLAARALRLSDALRTGLVFGLFQGGMPLIGYLVGARFGHLVEAVDHWLVFVVFCGLGVAMLKEAFGAKDDEDEDEDESADAPADTNPFALRALIPLGVATSIDAFAAGLTLPLLEAPLAASVVTIGVTTFVLAALGTYVGRRFGAMLGKRLDIAGGCILILLGFKFLLEHLLA